MRSRTGLHGKRCTAPGQPVYNVLTEAYGAYGIPKEQIEFVGWFHDTPETALMKLGQADVLFLTGGLPDVFHDRLTEWGLVSRSGVSGHRNGMQRRSHGADDRIPHHPRRGL